MSVNKFIGPSVALFLDSLVVAAGGWFFWLVISKFISAEEVGQATTVFSLVVLITTLTQLGLEYPLLKRSSNERSRILGSSLAIELLITLTAIPLVYYLLTNLYEESVQRFTLIAMITISTIRIEKVRGDRLTPSFIKLEAIEMVHGRII